VFLVDHCLCFAVFALFQRLIYWKFVIENLFYLSINNYLNCFYRLF